MIFVPPFSSFRAPPHSIVMAFELNNFNFDLPASPENLLCLPMLDTANNLNSSPLAYHPTSFHNFTAPSTPIQQTRSGSSITFSSPPLIDPLLIDNLGKEFRLEDVQRANLHAFIKVELLNYFVAPVNINDLFALCRYVAMMGRCPFQMPWRAYTLSQLFIPRPQRGKEPRRSKESKI
jgi:hypothetical protein